MSTLHEVHVERFDKAWVDAQEAIAALIAALDNARGITEPTSGHVSEMKRIASEINGQARRAERLCPRRGEITP